MDIKRDLGFWILIGLGTLLAVFLFVGQTLSLFDYDLTVSLGLQESEYEITKVGIAWAKGFAFGDTIFYLPILLVGIVGLLERKEWGIFAMFGSLAITAYWPIVSLFAIFIERTEIKLAPEKYITYSIILPLIAIYGLWGMWYLYKNKNKLIN